MVRAFGLLAVLLGLSSAMVASAAAAPEVAHGPADSHGAAAGHDDGHGLGHGHPNTDPGEIKADLAVFTAVVFLLLVVILRKFAWGPITSGLEKREHHIAEQIHGAEKANAEAKHLLAEYHKKLDEAQGEVRTILDDARRNAERSHQELLAQARTEAAAETARAKREIEAAKDAAMRELASVATDQALALAGKLLQQKLQPADHTRLINDALASFPASKANLN